MKDVFKFFQDFDLCLTMIEHKLRRKSIPLGGGRECVYAAMDCFFRSFGNFAKNKFTSRNDKHKITVQFNNLRQKWFLKSDSANRCFSKTIAYPGDFALMNRFFSNTATGSGLNNFIDKYFLNTECCEAFRRRKSQTCAIARKIISKSGLLNKPISMLDIGSGTACMTKQFLNQLAPPFKTTLKLTFIDSGIESGDYIKKLILTEEADVRFVNDDLLNMAKNDSINNFAGQNIIVSSGLFDYLTDVEFVRAIKILYKLLKPNGTILIGNMAACFSNEFELKWIWNIRLNLRRERDIITLLNKAKLENKIVTFKTDSKEKYHFVLIGKGDAIRSKSKKNSGKRN